jgi:hypothetical protein
MGAERKTK